MRYKIVVYLSEERTEADLPPDRPANSDQGPGTAIIKGPKTLVEVGDKVLAMWARQAILDLGETIQKVVNRATPKGVKDAKQTG
jgi:hypothetical protein